MSVRDIAAGAGVSHALVHRYVGSKRDVYWATLVRNEDVLRRAVSDDDDPSSLPRPPRPPERARDPDALDSRIVVASLVALLIGWIAADDWILRENLPAARGGPVAE